MELTCARAVDLGLPAVAFTEHADYTTWIVPARDLEEHEHLKTFATPDGSLTGATKEARWSRSGATPTIRPR